MDFNKDQSYKQEYNFSRVKFGINKPILETELNELQKIQEDTRINLVKKMIPSGFLEKIAIDFQGEPIIFNRNGFNSAFEPNTIAIAPCKAIIDGYEIFIAGTSSITGKSGKYEIIKLGSTNEDIYQNNHYDLIFLEMWFQEISGKSNIYTNGNRNASILPNFIIDDRVGEETSRRVSLQYRIRVEKAIQYDVFQHVFLKNDIYVQGPKKTLSNVFKFDTFLDSNVVISKSSAVNNIDSDLGILNGIVYAIPMFIVKRRVFKDYNATNIDLITNAPEYSANNLSYRPDGLFSDKIVKEDIIDLRRIVSFNKPNFNVLLDESFRNLICGSLSQGFLSEKVKQQINDESEGISFDGIRNAFDNRKHDEDIVQVVKIEYDATSFTLDSEKSEQDVLYSTTD